jgi:hypothetical protein
MFVFEVGFGEINIGCPIYPAFIKIKPCRGDIK